MCQEDVLRRKRFFVHFGDAVSKLEERYGNNSR